MKSSYYPNIAKGWEELKTAGKRFENAAQSDSGHEAILLPLRALIKKVGDASGMALDPDLRGTNLIYVAPGMLPRVQERLFGLVLSIESLLPKASRSREDVSKLSALSAVLENDLDRMRESASADYAGRRVDGESSPVPERAALALKGYESALMEFLVIGKLMTGDPNYRIPVADFLGPAQRAIEAASRLRQVSMSEVNALLRKRIQSFKEKKAAALCFSFAALFLAGAIVVSICRGITSPLGNLADIADEIASGDLKKARKRLEEAGERGLCRKGTARGVPVKIRNEVLKLFQAVSDMTASLDSLLAGVRESGAQVSSATAGIEASAGRLEESVTRQAASIRAAKGASAGISATAYEFAITMGRVTEMSALAAAPAGATMTGISKINGAMEALLESASQSSGELGAINEKKYAISAKWSPPSQKSRTGSTFSR